METPEIKPVEIKKGQGLVVKVTESGKSMLVGVKYSKYDSGYTFGWVANPDGCHKGDIIEDFNPRGREPMGDKVHEDGSPLMKFVFI